MEFCQTMLGDSGMIIVQGDASLKSGLSLLRLGGYPSVSVICLDPYSNGMWIEHIDGHFEFEAQSLNPYSNGMWIERHRHRS